MPANAVVCTVSDAARLLLTKVAHEHALPFDPLIPNSTTIAAMKEAHAGNLPRANSNGRFECGRLNGQANLNRL